MRFAAGQNCYMVNVEIVYVAADQSLVHVACQLPIGSKVSDALMSSGLFDSHPEIHSLDIGIFSKPASHDTLLKDGDRIEIYRPLLICPKERRRQRAKK